MAAEIWTAQLHVDSGTANEDAPEIAYAERPDYRGRSTHLYLLAESAKPGSDEFIGELVNRIGESFLEGQGTLTGILQRTLRDRHDELLDWNRNSLPRDQATYGVSCLILREGELFLCQLGPSLVYYRQSERIFIRRPASAAAAAPLGGPDFVAPEFTRIELEPDDWILLISSDAAAAITEPAVAAMRRMVAEDVLSTLYPLLHTRPRVSALVIAIPESHSAAAPAAGDDLESGAVPPSSAVPAPPMEEAAREAETGEDAIASSSTAEAPSTAASEQDWPDEEEEAAYQEHQPLGAALSAGLRATTGRIATAVTDGLAAAAGGAASLTRMLGRVQRRGSRPDPWKEAEADDSTWAPVEAAIAATEDAAPPGIATDAVDPEEITANPAAADETALESLADLNPAAADNDPHMPDDTDPPSAASTGGGDTGTGFVAAETENTAPADTAADTSEDPNGSEENATDDRPSMSGDAPTAGTVEFHFDPTWDAPEARNAGGSSIRTMIWPRNPFTPAPPLVLRRSGDVDAARMIRPLFGLRTYMPSFRRRPLPWRTAEQAESSDGFEARSSWSNIVTGLGAMLVLLGVVAGVLLVPDLVSDSERDRFDARLADARRSLTTATLTDDPFASEDELTRAQVAVEEALALRPLDTTALTLQQEVTAALQQADVIVQPPELAQVLDLREHAAPPLALGGVQVSEESAYLLDESGGRIFAIPLGGGDPTVVYQAGVSYPLIFQFNGPVAAQAISMAWYHDSRGVSLTILDANRRLYRYAPATGVVALEIPNAELLGSADAITVDAGVIALLDAEGGSVWRIAVQADGSLDAATPAIPRTDLQNATALALGSGIFIASSDGRVRRFLNGDEQPFAVRDLDRPLLVPASLAIGEISGLIYAADRGNNRIVVFTADGDLVAQIRDALLTGVRGIIPDEVNGRLYYVTADALLSSAMPSILGH